MGEAPLISDTLLLSLIVFLPSAAALLLVFVPGRASQLVKGISLAATIVTFLLTIRLLVQYLDISSKKGTPLEMRAEIASEYRAAHQGEDKPGDLVFFETVSRGASHVGLAIGSDEFVHAPSSRGVVRVEKLSASYWASRFVGARRVS